MEIPLPHLHAFRRKRTPKRAVPRYARIAALLLGVAAVPVQGQNGAASDWLRPIPEAAGIGAEGILYERWDDIPGDSVANLTHAASFRAAPDAKGLVDSLELPSRNEGPDGMRLRGYLVPPRSGMMQLALVATGNAELWLSPGKDPFARRRAAWVGGARSQAPAGEGPRLQQQRTNPILVEQGKEYYFEAYGKDSSEGFQIRWLFDDDTRAATIPATAMRALIPVAGDQDNNGLPDPWQSETGLAATEEPGAWGDPDGDGVSNFDEYVAGTNPVSGNEASGFLLLESWHGIAGGDVANLVGSFAYSEGPDHSEYLRGAETPVTLAGVQGSRLSGFIVPDEAGLYELSVTGDDSAELWLSDGPSSLRKQRIAFSDRWRKKGQWEMVAAQVSKPVELKVGQAYYLEILHKDAANPGWVAVAWRKEGTEKFSAIPPACLRSPGQQGREGREEVAARVSGSAGFARLSENQRNEVDASEQADPDRDGISNLEELRRGFDPLIPDTLLGAMTREWWLNKPGQSLEVARRDGSLLRPRAMSSFLDTADEAKDSTDWFVSRMRGSLVAPVSGSYRFWISGDDHCELWLSSDDRKFRKKLIAEVAPQSWEEPDAPAWTLPLDWDRSQRQGSSPVELKEGDRYFIEIIQKDGNGADHVALAWQYRGEGGSAWSERNLIDRQAISSHTGDPDDLDDDYLPDSWERQYGLDPLDNGLSDRSKQGENGDFDADKLSNREEFVLGTDPCSADSDGDGVGDYDEVTLYRSNPTKKDASPPVKVADIRLSRITAAPGDWSLTAGGTLFSTSRRGKAGFNFKTESAGIYLIELQALAHASDGYAPEVPVFAEVDGSPVGRGEVKTSGSTLRWFTPWLSAGDHSLTLDNRNIRNGVSLEIIALALFRYEGEDTDSNGIPDWLDKLFLDRNALGGSLASAISPLCLEGRERIVGSTRIQHPGGEVPAQEGLSGQWYANVPLNAAGETPVTVIQEGGAIRSDRVLNWSVTNLLEAADVIRVRKGDSLKVNAHPPGTDGKSNSARIFLDSSLLAEGTGDQTHVASFPEAGSFVLQATAVSGTETLESSVRIEVVEPDFGPSFSLASGTARLWTIPGVPRGLSLESDAELSLEESSTRSSQIRSLLARYTEDAAGSPRVVARLEPGGPIAAATSLNVFRIVASSMTRDVRLVDVLPDGTRVLEFKLLIEGRIPADLSIWLEFYVTDALFANGSTRYRLTAADFDENGVARIVVYKTPGDGIAKICHWIRPYGDDDSGPSKEEASGDGEAPAGEGD